jgi:hypothetical protein
MILSNSLISNRRSLASRLADISASRAMKLPMIAS